MKRDFICLPGCVVTYAPRGQTPILKVPLSWDHPVGDWCDYASRQTLCAYSAKGFQGDNDCAVLKAFTPSHPG